MAIVKVLARDWKLELDTDPLAATPTGAPVWTEVKGLNSLTFSSEKNDADTTTFDNNGFGTHLVASRSYSLEAEGFYLVDPTAGTRDAGQEAVEKYAEKMAAAGLASFQLTDPAGNVKSFSASVNVGEHGGGNDDAASWNCELTVSGQVTKS